MDDRFVVIHPLDDQLEKKVDIESLGPMPMTRGRRAALMSLRAYLVLIVSLVIYHVLALAGVV